jgi:hypothetical protein
MKRIALALFAVALASPAIARADDASKLSKIEELFTVMNVEQTQKQIIDLSQRQIRDAAQQQFHGGTPTPEQQKKFQDFQAKIATVVNGQISWPIVKPAFIKLYSDTYTEDELAGILAFYKSPAGHALLTKNPELTVKVVAVSRERLQQAQAQILGLIQDFGKDINTPASAAPAPAAPKGN